MQSLSFIKVTYGLKQFAQAWIEKFGYVIQEFGPRRSFKKKSYGFLSHPLEKMYSLSGLHK